MKALYVISGAIILVRGVLVVSGVEVMEPAHYGSCIMCYGIFAILVGLTGGKK